MKGLSDYFKVAILASGSPADYERKYTEMFPDNEIECSFKKAEAANLICKPTLNLINYADEKRDLPSAIYSMIKHEIAKFGKDPFALKSLINLSSIDLVHSVVETLRNNDACKSWHFVEVHSEKDVDTKEESATLKATIDGKDMDQNKIFDILTAIENDQQFEDEEPVLVFQVNMLSEGLNFNSFNSVFVMPAKNYRLVQQIGRVLRDMNKGDFNKLDDGHAMVYVGINGKEDLTTLVKNLYSYKLTSSEFNWGFSTDVSYCGEPSEEVVSTLMTFDWNPISELSIEEDIKAAEVDCLKSDIRKAFTAEQKEFIKNWIKSNNVNITKLLESIKKGDNLIVDKALSTVKTNRKDRKSVRALTKKGEEEAENNVESLYAYIEEAIGAMYDRYNSDYKEFVGEGNFTKENAIYVSDLKNVVTVESLREICLKLMKELNLAEKF